MFLDAQTLTNTRFGLFLFCSSVICDYLLLFNLYLTQRTNVTQQETLNLTNLKVN